MAVALFYVYIMAIFSAALVVVDWFYNLFIW